MSANTEVSSIITIDRSKPFELSKRWTIEEQDERSLALTEVDLTAIRFESTIKGGEHSITGKERLKRLKNAGYIRLDAKIFQTLWDNQHLIPANWKKWTNGDTTYIFFDGTIIRSPHGDHCALYLFWVGGQWHRDHNWLASEWDVTNPSAVL